MSSEMRYNAAVAIFLTGLFCSCSELAAPGMEAEANNQVSRATHRIVRPHRRTWEAVAPTVSDAERTTEEETNQPLESKESPLEIESIDRDDSGWGTITYTSGATRGTSVGGRDYPWFAYSSTMIVLHNGRSSCKVMDPDMNTISDGSTHSSGDFVALRIIGDNIIIETEDGRVLRTQTFDKHLSLLRDALRLRNN